MQKFQDKVTAVFKETEEGKGPKLRDWYLLGLVMLPVFLFFCFYKDFSLTMNQSLVFNDCFFSGKAHRFYSIVNEKALNGDFYYWPDTLAAGANYSAINYMTLGFVNLPLYAVDRLFSLDLPLLPYQVVVKLLYFVLLFAMVKIMQDIAKGLGCSEEKAKWTGFMFASSSLLIFTSLIILHLDIFPLFFALLGIRAMLAGNVRQELVFFSVAVLYKPYILLGILPMLLLQEKRILYLVRNAAAVLAGTLLQSVIYHFDAGYAEVKAFMENQYGFVDKFFGSGFVYERNAQGGIASYFIISFVLICVAAYAIRVTPHTEERGGKSIVDRRSLYVLLPTLVYGSFILFVEWHPNWLLLLVPFLILTMANARHFHTACLVETCISLFAILMSGLGWQNSYDQNMAAGGFLSKALHLEHQGATICQLLEQVGINMDLYMSLLAGSVIAMMLLLVWEYKNRNSEEPADSWNRGFVWIRVAPAGIFIVFSIITLFVGI